MLLLEKKLNKEEKNKLSNFVNDLFKKSKEEKKNKELEKKEKEEKIIKIQKQIKKNEQSNNSLSNDDDSICFLFII